MRYQPDFSWDFLPRQDRHPFLILKGDETVGVVIMRVADHVAHVELDYVTRRYRDFSPWRVRLAPERRAARLGISLGVTSPTMLDPYYERVGFRREGESYVLGVTAS